jgi:hypothetical protein
VRTACVEENIEGQEYVQERKAMKLYSTASHANISMIVDSRLRHLLVDITRRSPISHILESGTHTGLGSTKFIAEIFGAQSPPPQLFVTIEANHHSWQQARENLKGFSFVTPVWGLSTSRQEGLRFIQNDPALLNHLEYPDIFIDDVQDPINFYSREIAGGLGGGTRNPLEKIRRLVDRPRYYSGESLLMKWLDAFRSYNPLVVLDSAGGVGYLEFNTVQQYMSEHAYFLLLDDICHVKHFRSYEYVHNNSNFAVIGENKDAGWLLAKYEPTV